MKYIQFSASFEYFPSAIETEKISSAYKNQLRKKERSQHIEKINQATVFVFLYDTKAYTTHRKTRSF